LAYLQLYNKGVLRLTLEQLNELINNGILAARSFRQTKTKGIWFGTGMMLLKMNGLFGITSPQ